MLLPLAAVVAVAGAIVWSRVVADDVGARGLDVGTVQDEVDPRGERVVRVGQGRAEAAGEAGVAGLAPRQREALAPAGLEVVDEQRVDPCAEGDRPVLGRVAVQAVVVDDEGERESEDFDYRLR